MRAGFRCALNIGLHLADVLLAPVGSGSMWNGNGVPNPINPSWSSERWAVRGELATVSPFAHKARLDLAPGRKGMVVQCRNL